MIVVLATLGTDGDVFPHMGLGAVLVARGHRVILAAPETYGDRAEALGMEFCPLVTTEEVQQMLADPDLWHPLKSGIMMARWGGPMIGRHYETLARLAQHSETVLVANPGVLAARLVQETVNIPMVTLLLQPGLLPSNIAPPQMPCGLTIPKWLPHSLRHAYWLGVDAAGSALTSPWLNRVRRGLGLAPVRRLFRWWLSPELVIGLFPGWYAAPQADWPSQIRLAGFTRFDGCRTELAEDLRSFCMDGPPPILFTLGTGMTHAADFFRAALEACRMLDVRAIFVTRYANLIPPNLPPSVRHCAFAPFRHLLPLCAAVVHHGGVGTTAAALEAACPQLVLPLAWDQPDNAARVFKLGAGLVLGRQRRSGKHLRNALVETLSPAIRNRCQTIASEAEAECGLGVAATWIEEVSAKRNA